MLFNSYSFIFFFLPITLAGFFALGRVSATTAAAWLTAASLVFYGWWNPLFVILLLASVIFNYRMGLALAISDDDRWAGHRKLLLAAAIGTNLAVLGYFKYANFFLTTISTLSGSDIHGLTIILPLGISFFTFTQIAYLVDAFRGEVKEPRLIHYALFVTYFPHLIAGPVLHHKEMMPQFAEPRTYRLNWSDFAVGITIFFIGLFKKVVIADGIAPLVSVVFGNAATGEHPALFDAWGGALAYTMQLYFDFSGYSDMAIGLSRMFGVKLPLNFNSPYKSVNVIEFWRRWHMTLSRFLRDYLYIPLGGSRKGQVRRYESLMITMLLGGLWHGAAWNFVLWGGLHGLYLVINHGWRWMRSSFGADLSRSSRMGRVGAQLLTFVAVVIGWVFFRAATSDAALRILGGMAGMNGVALPQAVAAHLGSLKPTLQAMGIEIMHGGGGQFVRTYLWLALLLPAVMFWPNTQEVMARFAPGLDPRTERSGAAAPAAVARLVALRWAPTPLWALAMAAISVWGLLSLSHPSEFLYYQF